MAPSPPDGIALAQWLTGTSGHLIGNYIVTRYYLRMARRAWRRFPAAAGMLIPYGRRAGRAGQLSGQVGMSSLPKVALVTWAKATYQAETPQVMPTYPPIGSSEDVAMPSSARISST